MKKLPKIQHVLLFVLGLLSINACEKLPENDIEENLAIEGLACGNYTANGILVAEQDVADGFVISIPYTILLDIFEKVQRKRDIWVSNKNNIHALSTLAQI